jgi:glutathione synthetase
MEAPLLRTHAATAHRSPLLPRARAAAAAAAAPGRHPRLAARAAAMDLIAAIEADPARVADLAEDAAAWAATHGLVYGAALPDHPAALVPAPLALLPTPYPRAAFAAAAAAAPAFNALADAVSRDEEYLRRVLAPAARHDAFTAALLRVHAATAAARAARTGRDLSLAVTRSDYMLHEPTGQLLQVELNTIASSFGCLASVTAALHRHLLEREGAAAEDLDAALPPNGAMDAIADALGAAAAAHGAEGGVALFVVQPGERNAYDQRWLAHRLWERCRVRVLRRTLAEVAARGALDAGGRLVVDGAVASVVYFRAGYTPDDYPTAAEWAARELVERSDAAACPTVAMQLAGAKKVQQDLAAPGAVERFAPPAAAAQLRAFFAGLWALDAPDDAAAAAAIADALRNPDSYVLKPQREGGGNNLYGAALAARLAAGGDLGALILMARIRPPVRRAVMVRGGAVDSIGALSELGVFGVFLRRGDEVLLNAGAGHLVRTKAATSDEGGVAAGYAVLDSPVLV